MNINFFLKKKTAFDVDYAVSLFSSKIREKHNTSECVSVTVGVI